MLNSKILLIKKEFIKLNEDNLILGVFINLRDFILSTVPTANFITNAINNNITIAALDKFSLSFFSYFISLFTSAITFSVFQYKQYADKIDNLISSSLFFLTGDQELSYSIIVLTVAKILIIGIIINLIIAIIYRKKIQRKKTSIFYQQFDENLNAEYDKYVRAFPNQNSSNLRHDFISFKRSIRYSQLLLYLHNIRVLNINDINELIKNQELMAAKLNLKNLRSSEIQDQMLKYLDSLARNKNLDFNSRNLRENLIFRSNNNQLKEPLLTGKFLESIVKLMPSFDNFINSSNIVIKDLTSLSENFNRFIIKEISNIQNNINLLIQDPKQKSNSSLENSFLAPARFLVEKLNDVYNMLSKTFKDSFKGEEKDFKNNYLNDQLIQMKNQINDSIKNLESFLENSQNTKSHSTNVIKSQNSVKNQDNTR